jgi:lipoprotein-anchoring transpeptidase ErfK/SrfK
MHPEDGTRERTTRGSGRRRLWVRLAIVFGVIALCLGASYRVLTGKTADPQYTLWTAQNAIARARIAGAARWAPNELKEAEATLREGVLEHRVQEMRLLPLRDFTRAREILEMAEAKGRSAREDAVAKRQDVRASATEALAEAQQDTRRSSEFAESMHLGLLERTILSRARLALNEAKILHGQGEYTEALDRARFASTQSKQVTERAVAAASRFTDRRLVASWRRMVEETIAWSRRERETAIVVLKDNHRLTLYHSGKPVKVFKADMGYKSVNDKSHAGDAATPEGRYTITAKKNRSTYYKALLLNYPNAEDRANFERLKRGGSIPRSAKLGGMIEIHGDGGRGKDWTRGCVALSNHDMDELFKKVDVGTPVTIVGGDGNGGTFTELVRQTEGQSAESAR